MKLTSDLKKGDYINTPEYKDAIFIEAKQTDYAKIAYFRYQATKPDKEGFIWVLSSSDFCDVSFSKKKDPTSIYVANLKGFYGEGYEYPPLPPKNEPIVIEKRCKATYEEIMDAETECYFYLLSIVPKFSDYFCSTEFLEMVRQEWNAWYENYYDMKYAELGWTREEVDEERERVMNKTFIF